MYAMVFFIPAPFNTLEPGHSKLLKYNNMMEASIRQCMKARHIVRPTVRKILNCIVHNIEWRVRQPPIALVLSSYKLTAYSFTQGGVLKVVMPSLDLALYVLPHMGLPLAPS